MIFYIRVDSSLEIGTGHVSRCLTLADHLLRCSHQVEFICKEHPGNSIKTILEKGYKVHKLVVQSETKSTSSNCYHSGWLGGSVIDDVNQVLNVITDTTDAIMIVDHYALDVTWEAKISRHINKIIVIDDLADRPHMCNLLIDQNPYQNKDSRYKNLLINIDTKKLLGANYAMLRQEFKNNNNRKRNKIENILIFMGGIDKDGWTLEIVNKIDSVNFNIKVLVGNSNPYKSKIESLCNSKKLEFICHTDKISELFNWADLAIGAGGTTTLERCSVGLPSIVYAIAENQKKLASDLDKVTQLYAGSEISSVNKINHYISQLIDDPSLYNDIQNQCTGLVNKAGIEEVYKQINLTQIQ